MSDYTQNTLKFIIGEESTPVIEGVDRYDTSIFKPVYDNVFAAIVDFAQDSFPDFWKEETSKKDTVERNNIFVFAGERGMGKSSCMQSVVKMLTEERPQVLRKIGRYDERCGAFMAMDLVDPGFFEQDNNLLQLVVGKMFRAFKEQVEYRTFEKNNKLNQQSKKRDLVDLFEKTYRNIRTLFKKSEVSNESLDALLDLSASYDLRDNFKNLVKGYLEFMPHEEGPARQLIIPIDDIDLQTKHAYAMAEQIRKYMMHDNVLIFMAIRIGQLEDVVAKEYITEFQLSLGKGVMDKDEPIQMSERYVAKLIPQQRRFFLPLMETSFETKLTIEKNGKIDQDYDELTVRETVLTLIYRKTRFLFYNSKGVTSYIVPRNLRELRNLVRLLYDMKDYLSYGDQGEKDYNKVLFQRYFMDSWLKSNLEESNVKKIREIWNADTAIKNKLIISSLYNGSFVQKGEDIEDANFELSYITNKANMAYNLSAGDALGALSLRMGQAEEEKERKLLFAIQTIYSMFLYEAYNRIDQSTAPKKERVQAEDILDAYSEYRKLIGHNVINPLLYSIVPPKMAGNKERAIIRIKRKELNDVIQKERQRNKEQPRTPEEIAELNFVEFLVLNATRRWGTKNEYDTNKFRQKRDIAYQIEADDSDLTFELTGFTANLSNIDTIYETFGLDKNDTDSLYQKITTKLREEQPPVVGRDEAVDRAYLSRACLRNAEVINNMLNYVLTKRVKGGDDRDNIIDFYKKLAGFAIKTYDTDEDETNEKKRFNYFIKFDFIQVFADAIVGAEPLWDQLLEFGYANKLSTQPTKKKHSSTPKKEPSDVEKKMPKFTGSLPEERYTKEQLLSHYNNTYGKPQHRNMAYDPRVLANVVGALWPQGVVDLSSDEAHNFMKTVVAPKYSADYGQS